jgi:hypothetical protein
MLAILVARLGETVEACTVVAARVCQRMRASPLWRTWIAHDAVQFGMS